jgi:hypothetical protein
MSSVELDNRWRVEHAKERRTQEEFGFSLLFLVTGKCENCGSNSNFFNGLTEDEFLSKNSYRLLSLSLILTISWASGKSIQGHVRAVCPNSLLLDDPQIKDIEAAFVDTYNAAASTYCERFPEP